MNVWTPTLAEGKIRQLRCPRTGSYSRLGTARRRSIPYRANIVR